MGQRDLLLVMAHIRLVSTLGKEAYYWCRLKYGKYMGQSDLLLLLAQLLSVSTWGKVTY